VASSFSPTYFFGVFLWGHVKEQVYSQRVNMVDRPKVRVTVAIANVTKNMLGGGIAYSVWRLATGWITKRTEFET
jgi:hypothetical protein